MFLKESDEELRARKCLVESLRRKGIFNEKILSAMMSIPRHYFMNETDLENAYADLAYGIECGQTISQPFVVATMTQTLLAEGDLKNVLEIGTGSGYQAAILSQLVPDVYTVERIKQLHSQAKQRFVRLKLNNIHSLHGDGMKGWAEYAPYDGIIITAATEKVPNKLLEQLGDGGRMVVPVGDRLLQYLQLITRKGDDYEFEVQEGVMFVPLLPGTEE